MVQLDDEMSPRTMESEEVWVAAESEKILSVLPKHCDWIKNISVYIPI